MYFSYIAVLCLGVLHKALLLFAEGSGDVLELRDADFERRVAEHETLLVEFFAPWYARFLKVNLIATQLGHFLRTRRYFRSTSMLLCGSVAVVW